MYRLVRRTIPSFRSFRRRRDETLRALLERDHRTGSEVCSSTACASSSLKVAIIGAAGKTGKCLALFLKQSPIIDELAIYDIHPTYGLALELSHFNSRCKTICYEDDDQMDGPSCKRRLERTLRAAKVVAISLENDYLHEEAACLRSLVPSLLACCPKAFVALLSRSVNSLLPMMYELYKQAGFFDHNRLFGVTSLFSTRANTFAADVLAVSPEFVTVPLIGGGCSRTCIPIFSQTRPCASFSPEEFAKLTYAMKMSEEYVAEAYGPMHATESSSYTAGFAAARFCISLCKGLRAESGVVESAYVRSCLIPELKYLTSPLELGPCGLQRYLGLPKLTNRECGMLYGALPEIQKAIALGESLVLGSRRSTEICSILPRCTALQVYQENAAT